MKINAKKANQLTLKVRNTETFLKDQSDKKKKEIEDLIMNAIARGRYETLAAVPAFLEASLSEFLNGLREQGYKVSLQVGEDRNYYSIEWGVKE